MGFSFDSRGQESGSVFGAAVCKIQAGNCYIVSLLVLKDEKTRCFTFVSHQYQRNGLGCF